MSKQSLLAVVAVFLFSWWACAPPPGSEGDPLGELLDEEEMTDYEDLDEADLPEWARGLEEGDPPPEDTEWSEEVETELVQADLLAGDAPEVRERHLRNAIEAAEEGIENDRENPIHYFLAGQAHMFLEEYKRGAEYFDEAEARHERYRLDTELLREEAWIDVYNEGVELLNDDQEDAAIAQFERAHRIYQKRPEAMVNLASLYHERGQLEEASHYYGEALEVLEGPRVDDLEEEEREAWDGQIKPARFNRALINIEIGNYAEAAKDYEQILERDPDNVMALSNLSVAYMQMGEDERAREIYAELFEQEDLMMEELLLIGGSFYESEDWERAAEAFERVLERDPGHREAKQYLAVTYYEMGEEERAIDLADELGIGLEASPGEEVADTTWTTIGSWDGEGMQNTQTFDVPTDEWRIEWEASGGTDPSLGIFQIYVYRRTPDPEDPLVDVAANQQGPGSATTYIRSEPGGHYLEINSANIGWSVEVQVRQR